MNKPKLRFKEFSEEWKQCKLGDIAEVRTGKAFSSADFNDDGKYLVITNKNIQDEANGIVSVGDRIDIYDDVILDNYLLSGDNILVTMDGANIGKTGKYSNEKAVLAQRVGRLNSEQLEFVYQITSSNKFVSEMNKLSVGNAIKHISLKQISDYSFLAPISEEEQERIGDFFKHFDQKIQLQKERIDLLKEQKKGYIQKTFNQELRFKNNDEREFPEWELNIKAEKLFEPISNKSHNGDLPVLSATQDKGMVYRESLERHMAFNDENLVSYKLVEKNDFVISLRSFQGGIEFSHLQGLASPAYTIFRKKTEKVYEPYFAILFKTDSFIQRLNSTTYGIRDGKAISYKDFSTLKFNIPSIKEQKKIAEFINLLDRKIQLEQEKLATLQTQKQAFMQQVFI